MTAEPRSWLDRAPLMLPTGTVDFARTRFRRHDGRLEPLTAREAELVAFLADSGNRAVSRDEIRVRVFGQAELSMSRAVDTMIRRLRVKLEPDPTAPQTLFTAHGHGYRLLTDEPATTVRTSQSMQPRRLLHLGEHVVDLSAGWCDRGQERLGLTASELLLLEHLADARGAAVPTTTLARRAGITGGKAAVTNAIYRLRAKIEPDPGKPAYLVSAPGVGYRLDATIDEPVAEREHLVHALRSLTSHVGQIVGFDDCVAYVRRGDLLTQVAAYGPKEGPDGEVLAPLTQAIGEGIVGQAAAEGRPLRIGDVTRDVRYLRDLRPALSELAVPVAHRGFVMGVIDSESTRLDAYSDAMLTVIASLASIAAPAFAKLHATSAQ
jgi:DNA-binding response OmpR family regulator/putative methionine-R-sulfoxide reductase with GAF domain